MPLKTKSLTPELINIIRDKGTEQPFTGDYTNKEEAGSYLCRQCGLALFRSQTKFHSMCGWPSFDEEIVDTIKKIPDPDGLRTEILCNRCDAHLGHLFQGERITTKNIRYCVNSLSLDFVADGQVTDTEEALFAAGCFWGVEYYFQQLPGVVKTEVGYSGGHIATPSYDEICSTKTGHYETIRVVYDISKVSFEAVAKYFFEIHDPTQTDGQGPDIGEQYLSAIFYYDELQKTIAQHLVTQLEKKRYLIATQILPVQTFWPAEDYHQKYYTKTNKQPYCHHYQKRF